MREEVRTERPVLTRLPAHDVDDVDDVDEVFCFCSDQAGRKHFASRRHTHRGAPKSYPLESWFDSALKCSGRAVRVWAWYWGCRWM